MDALDLTVTPILLLNLDREKTMAAGAIDSLSVAENLNPIGNDYPSRD